MARQIKDIVSRSGASLLADALGVTALFVMLVVVLNLTGVP